MYHRAFGFQKLMAAVIFLSLILFSPANKAEPLELASLQMTAASKVYLVATINNGPAMKPVKWKVFRLHNGEPQLIQSFQRHSVSMRLEPGRYRAIASLDSTQRSREFDVRTFANSNIVVAMDQ